MSLSKETVAERDWRDRIVNPGPLAAPRAVTVEGNGAEVENVDALLNARAGVTTLRTSGEHSARLIVDFGILAMGHLELRVARAEGAAIRVAHAQFREFLTPEGDGFGYASEHKPSD
ncbi:MAG TPA: hypothetical protein VK486_01505, partial [Thermoleophilaceae bacterium]|nr:hypothetical protein [Thermoleophilaceae bacterium]